MTKDQTMKRLKAMANPQAVIGMKRFAVGGKNTLGISIPKLRNLAKQIGSDHQLAQELWNTGIHEARILASMIDDPKKVTEKQLDLWVADFDSWDVCDQTCMNLFDKTSFAFEKAIEWPKNNQEFIRRAGFAMTAVLAWHRRDLPNSKFKKFFPIIKKYSTDERNFVRKAVNWALRQIGKRDREICQKAISVAKEIKHEHKENKTANWIASDALRELEKKIKNMD